MADRDLREPLDAARLDDLIGAQLAATAGLVAILEQEWRALEGDVTELLAVSQTKVEALERLERLHRESHDVLVRAGVSGAGREAMRRHLQRAGGDLLARRWRQLEESIDRCREANRANGAAIERGRRRITEALAAVRGQARSPALYGAQGVARTTDPGRMLARA